MTPNKQSIELMTWFQVPLFTSPRLLEAFVTISLHGQCVEPLSTWHLSFSIAKVMARPWIGNSAKSIPFWMSCHYVWICYCMSIQIIRYVWICLRIAIRGQLSRVVRYSLGALAYEMLTGLPPYYTQDTALGGLLLLLFFVLFYASNKHLKNGSTLGTKNLNYLYDMSGHSLHIRFNLFMITVCLIIKALCVCVCVCQTELTHCIYDLIHGDKGLEIFYEGSVCEGVLDIRV